MKFVEAKLQKLIKLTMLHKQLFSRVADFELSEFGVAEIKQLEEHFNLDLLVLVDCVLA